MRLLNLLTLMFAVSMASADTAEMTLLKTDPEAELLSAINVFRQGELDVALDMVEELLSEVPNYRLAHLVHGDLMAASAGRPLSFEASSTLSQDSIKPLLHEVRQRYRGNGFLPTQQVPAALIKMTNAQTHAVAVDLSLSRLYLFENLDGEPRLIKDYYVSIGKNGPRKEVEGDRRTPLGVYKVTQRLPGEKLPDKYGPVAFPVNYPNSLDRVRGKTGSGIWLHGMPSKNYSRPPLDSDGCVALTNRDLMEIAPLITPGITPVLIGETLDWVSNDVVLDTRREIEDSLDRWRRSWSEENTEAFLSHYDESFEGRGMDINGWRENKRQVIPNSGDISVSLSNVGLLAHPEEDNLVLVTFRQHYKSAKFSSSINKRQYWRKTRDGWRIVFEGS
ncbi:MAG: L,D-transpeptidase family protein [Pseudomonadota bacterium]